ncbi:hypothetical protein WR25_20172 [Diploscapter pachys]|uniref:Uncharacterized protein n=1 Tax=Diploscapter pachys TaxID=2018661 RepID=A0A2A2M4U9_9BILA|nr:hypothetical protein WR25_20172 [Diploscapter pachys]
MREGQAIYTITGQSLISPPGEDPFGGEREDSASLKNAPPGVREHMDAVWQQAFKAAHHQPTTRLQETSHAAANHPAQCRPRDLATRPGQAAADHCAGGAHAADLQRWHDRPEESS